MKHTYFFIILMILLTTAVTAQVTLVAPNKMIRSGDSVVVELRAKMRDTLSTLQFTMSWNPAILSFGRVDTLGGFPPSALSDEFGTANLAQGKLTFLWISTDLNGLKVTDSLDIFKIVFKAIGANGTNSPLQYLASPTQIKASNAQLLGFMVTTQAGSIKIGTTATHEVNSQKGLQLEQNKPNPFRNQTTIPFHLQEADEVVLTLCTINGQKVIEKTRFFDAGNHEWMLNTEGVLAKGIYMYSMRTAHPKYSGGNFDSKVLIIE